MRKEPYVLRLKPSTSFIFTLGRTDRFIPPLLYKRKGGGGGGRREEGWS